MRYHKIPKQLKVKVRNYFYHRYHGRLFNEKTMLKELSHVLEEVRLCTIILKPIAASSKQVIFTRLQATVLFV